MPHEIERKFLVNPDLLETLSGGTLLRQGYLETSEITTVRVRIKGDRGFLSVKGPPDESGMVRLEFEYEIPLTDAQTIIDTLCGDRVLEKVRHVLRIGEHDWEVDVFHGRNTGLILAEVELGGINESVQYPEWIECEVTGDERYYNRRLIDNPWPDWR